MNIFSAMLTFKCFKYVFLGYFFIYALYDQIKLSLTYALCKRDSLLVNKMERRNSVEKEILISEHLRLRSSFRKLICNIDNEFTISNLNSTQLQFIHAQIKDNFDRLCAYQEKIWKRVVEFGNEREQRQLKMDFDEAEVDRDIFTSMDIKLQNRLKLLTLKNCSKELDVQNQNFLSVKFQLKKFSGDAKDFASFWNQFERIHFDDTLSDEDKFQYLLKATVPQSKAATIVEKYPATAENYTKVVKELKAHFGQEDLLVQKYVQEMLTMAMKNAKSGRAKTNLAGLYNELEDKLLALSSLGRTQEKYGEFLVPLVEACLPEDVLDALKKNRNKLDSNQAKNNRTVENVMNFLKQMVMGEEMITLVRTVFQIDPNEKAKESFKEDFQDILSATILVSSVESSSTAKDLNKNSNERNPDCLVNLKYVTLNNILPWSEYAKNVMFHGLTPVCTINPRLNEKVSLFSGDITTLKVDAIVNSSNIYLRADSVGVNGAVHRAAGPSLLEECETVNGCHPGDAKITQGYQLPAKYVIHTVATTDENVTKLADCYKKCLKVALENEIRTIAFPCISAGMSNYHNKKAADVAIRTVRKFLEQHGPHFDRVIFCLFLRVDVVIYGALMQEYFPA